MKVQELMSSDVVTCRPDDMLERAAQIMWEHDCGAVPVVDAESHVVGVITDRDVCMASYTQGRPLWQIPVSTACSHTVYSCTLSDSVQNAEKLMRTTQVRRLPVVDTEGKLWGVISLGDLAQHVHRPGRKADGLSYESVASTLAAVSQPPAERASSRSQLELTAPSRLSATA
jgi:CBS domain-containing protein